MKEITPLLNGLKEQCYSHIDKFVYDFKRSWIANYNIGVEPPLIPIFWKAIIEDSKILGFMEAAMSVLRGGQLKVTGIPPEIQPDVTTTNILVARSQNCYAATLRELDVCFKLRDLDENCRIYKDINMDLGQGRVDLIYRRSNKQIYYLAVAHEGRYSEKYEKLRKSKKEDEETIKLTASNEKHHGLHVVSVESIKEVLEL